MENVISAKFAKRLGLDLRHLKPHAFSTVGTAKAGNRLKVLGVPTSAISLQFGGHPSKFKIKPLVVEGLTMNVNISGPFMEKHCLDQIHSKRALKVNGRLIPLIRPESEEEICAMQAVEDEEAIAYVAQTVTVPPLSARFIRMRVPAVEDRRLPPGPGLIEAQAHFVEKTNLHPTLAAITNVNDDGFCFTSVLNTLESSIEVPAGLRFGSYTPIRTELKDVRTWRINAIRSPASEAVKKADRQWLEEEFKLKESPFLQAESDRRAALDLLEEYADLFSHGDRYGRTELVQHCIRTQDVPPIKCKSRPMNPVLEGHLKKQLDHWQEQDVIEPSESPWSFPPLAVPKKNGKIRFCIDYRRLNDVTLKDSFPLPNIEDNLSRLSKSKIFSGLDGAGAYHVVSIRPEDKEKTAFSTPWGLFQFKRMPFGLCNAPATYSRLVSKVLQGIPTEVAIPYLDDTCVHSPDLKQHLSGLRRVFEAHRTAGLTLQPEKCNLFQKQIEYLGHMVSEDGISIPERYLKDVAKWPPPTTVSQIRTFLGKVSYYRKFFKHYSRTAAPLSDLTKDEQNPEEPFDLEKSYPLAQKAFLGLRDGLLKAPVLAYPDFLSDEPFIVDTDWSQEPGAIGAVLSQVQNGQERVLAYGAKKLEGAEKNYSSNKGELLAVIYFLRYWKYYLSHRPFILRTDHEALKWIRTMEEPKGMILRWQETLANFNFTTVFRKGTSHGNADALSRITHAETKEEESADTGEHPSLLAPLQLQEPDQELQALKDAQQADEDLQTVMGWIANDQWPDETEKKRLGPSLRLYASLRPTLRVNEAGLLVRNNNVQGLARERPCLPAELQEAIALECHEETGHRGINNTYEQINRRFFFPGSTTLATLVVQQCPVCGQNRADPHDQRHTHAAPLREGYPFQRISIDFVGPLRPSNQGNTHILTVKDCFTRWIEAFACNDMSAKTVASLLQKEIFSRYGIPEVIHSDNGTQFAGELLGELYKELGIERTLTPKYNPKSNPVERTHKDLGQLLRSCVQDSPQDWEDFLPDCLLALRVARAAGTGYSPFLMMYGRECNLPIDLRYGKPHGEPYGPNDYVNQVRDRLDLVHRRAREQLDLNVARVRRQYTGKLQGAPLQANDLVWLYTPRARDKKLQSRWTGPYRIISEVSPVLFSVLPHGNWHARPREATVSIDRLRRYNAQQPPDPLERPPGLDEIEDDDEFGELPAADPPPQDEPPWEGGGGGGGGGLPPPPPDPRPPPQPPAVPPGPVRADRLPPPPRDEPPPVEDVHQSQEEQMEVPEADPFPYAEPADIELPDIPPLQGTVNLAVEAEEAARAAEEAANRAAAAAPAGATAAAAPVPAAIVPPALAAEVTPTPEAAAAQTGTVPKQPQRPLAPPVPRRQSQHFRPAPGTRGRGLFSPPRTPLRRPGSSPPAAASSRETEPVTPRPTGSTTTRGRPQKRQAPLPPTLLSPADARAAAEAANRTVVERDRSPRHRESSKKRPAPLPPVRPVEPQQGPWHSTPMRVDPPHLEDQFPPLPGMDISSSMIHSPRTPAGTPPGISHRTRTQTRSVTRRDYASVARGRSPRPLPPPRPPPPSHGVRRNFSDVSQGSSFQAPPAAQRPRPGTASTSASTTGTLEATRSSQDRTLRPEEPEERPSGPSSAPPPLRTRRTEPATAYGRSPLPSLPSGLRTRIRRHSELSTDSSGPLRSPAERKPRHEKKKEPIKERSASADSAPSEEERLSLSQDLARETRRRKKLAMRALDPTKQSPARQDN